MLWRILLEELGAARLELAETEVDGFTVHCNCHYATPPEGKKCWRKELNPQPSDYKSGALPIELLQQNAIVFTRIKCFGSTENDLAVAPNNIGF